MAQEQNLVKSELEVRFGVLRTLNFTGFQALHAVPTHDSPEAAQSASQRRATPRTGILSGSPRSGIPFQSFPGSSTPQNTGSVTDSQLLYISLVQDCAIPPGFLLEFESLMASNEADADRQTMSSQPSGSVRSRRSRTREEGKRRQQQTFVQAASLKPRRFKSRLARTLAAGPETGRRRAREEQVGTQPHTLVGWNRHSQWSPPREQAVERSVSGSGPQGFNAARQSQEPPKVHGLAGHDSPEVFPTSTSSTCKSGSQNRRTEEPTKPATLLSSFSRKLPGLPAERKQTSTELYTFMYKEVLSQATPGRPVRQTSRMFVRLLAEIETLVVDPSKQTYLRIIGWWILLQSWGTLSQGTTSASQERGRSEPCTNSACALHCRTWTTIPAKIITEMRGADYIVFRINLNGKFRNSMRFLTFSN